MIVNFCEKCGLRIAAPGKCKACDPASSVEEHAEAAPKPAKPKLEPKPAAAPEK